MHHEEDKRHLCVECGGNVPLARYKLGYKICTDCGEYHAKIESKRKASMELRNHQGVSDKGQGAFYFPDAAQNPVVLFRVTI